MLQTALFLETHMDALSLIPPTRTLSLEQGRVEGLAKRIVKLGSSERTANLFGMWISPTTAGQLSTPTRISIATTRRLEGVFLTNRCRKGILMGQTIEIRDTDAGGVLTVQLRDILSVMPPEFRHRDWQVYELRATGNLGNSRSLPDLESRVETSAQGIVFSWNELWELSDKLDQVIDAIVILPRKVPLVFKAKDIQKIRDESDVMIEAVDSTFWRVFSRDEKVLNALRGRYKAVADTE
jgi:hypothetical protein